DRPTSGPLPAEIAWVILASSWPALTITLTWGNFAEKSSTTCWIAAASRSVKKCQNSMVPEAVAPGEATCCGFADGTQPAVASAAAVRQAAARTPRRRWRIIEMCSSRQRGVVGLSGTDLLGRLTN